MEKLIEVLKLSRENLINYILETFKNKDEKIITDYDNYILIMRDETYPVLVCHIDTVHDDENPLFEERPIIVINDYITSPEGLGADDRAGVYFLLEYGINYPVNLLFCNYEEYGSIGAKKFTKDYPEILKNSKCFIEFDRANMDEYVSYVNNEIAFEKIFKQYYYKAKGTSSDVKSLSLHYGIASVNLSIGYRYQHTIREILYPEIFQITNHKLSKILPQINRQYKICNGG